MAIQVIGTGFGRWLGTALSHLGVPVPDRPYPSRNGAVEFRLIKNGN